MVSQGLGRRRWLRDQQRGPRSWASGTGGQAWPSVRSGRGTGAGRATGAVSGDLRTPGGQGWSGPS